MATAVFYQEGHYVDYTPSSAVSAGDVIVQSTLVGVATADIAANVQDAIRIDGVWKFPKSSGTSTAIDAGDKVYWDATNEVMTETAAGNTGAGICVEDAGDDDTTVKVLLTPNAFAS